VTERPDRFDLAALVALAALSLAFLVWIFVRGGVFGGWEGFVVADQGQYLVWIREAGEHVLIANRFDMRPDDHVFLHPTLLISGLLTKVGFSEPLAYLVWKPVGVAVLFYGVWRYVRHRLADLWERRAALVLALFSVPPFAVLSPLWGESGRGTFDFISGEVWPAGHFWGYPMSALCVGITPIVFIWVERAVGEGRRGREIALAAAAGALVASLHPWQGAMIVGVAGAAGLWQVLVRETNLREAGRILWPVLVVPLVPALYLLLLGRFDASWELGTENYSTPLDGTMTLRAAIALAPLALPALLGYRGKASGIGERMLRLWVPLGLAMYLFPGTPVRFHAFNGLSIPLAILAVRGLAPYLRGRPLAIAAAAAAALVLIVPGTFDRIRSARGAVYLNQQPYNLDEGERDALNAVEAAPGPGGVMAPVDFAALVPYETGRETWVATPSWSPDFGERSAAVANLFQARLQPDEARRFVRSTGVRFIVSDCRHSTDLAPLLGPLVTERRYGCARVYEVRPRA
jgi:hypothetical protein